MLGIAEGLESLRRSIPRQNVSLERKVVIDGGRLLDHDRAPTRIDPMKAWAKGVCVSLLLVVILLAIPVTYSTARGYTQWWLMSGGHVVVNGVRSGYLHKNWSRSAVIITRTDSERGQSYLVRISGEEFSQSMIYGSGWHAPRLPAFPIGDVNPPCIGFLDDHDPPDADRPQLSTLTAKGFVEFSTVQGKKVKATW
jgi:hypothetical protein